MFDLVSVSIDCACELMLVHFIVLAPSLGKYTSLSLEFDYRSCIQFVLHGDLCGGDCLSFYLIQIELFSFMGCMNDSVHA